LIVTRAVSRGNVPGEGGAALGPDEHAPTLAAVKTIAYALRNRLCTSAPHFISPSSPTSHEEQAPHRLTRRRQLVRQATVGLTTNVTDFDVVITRYRDAFVDNHFRLWVDAGGGNGTTPLSPVVKWAVSA
jgi:hypothetical protein